MGKGRSKLKAPLINLPVISKAWSRVAIDVVGPLSVCKNTGNKYSMTMLDVSTHYPLAFPLQNYSASEVAKCLNAITCDDSFPMPRVEDFIDKVGKAKYMSKLYLSRGFWQVEFDEESVPLTGFVLTSGHYQWKCMRFGLKWAPATIAKLGRVLVKVCKIFVVCFSMIELFQWVLVGSRETSK